MVDKKFGSIKIDWQNLKVQFSPNINLTSKIINYYENGGFYRVLYWIILSDKIFYGLGRLIMKP